MAVSLVARTARDTVEGQNWEQSVRRVREVYAEAVRVRTGQSAAWTLSERLASISTRTLVSLFRWMAPRDRRPQQEVPVAVV
jgi:hypothetical protein